MRRADGLLIVCVFLSLQAACRSTGAMPLVLYEGPIRPPSETSVIRVVQTHPRGGHPTVDVRKITRLDFPSGIVFQASESAGWQIPSHFMGPPDDGRQTRSGDPGELPTEFHLAPGTYQIDFLYVPAVDHWGWTHVTRVLSTVRLTCGPGFAYLLEGRYLEEGGGWTLVTLEEAKGAGGAIPEVGGVRPPFQGRPLRQ